MIVCQVDIEDVALFEAKHDSPISSDSDTPQSLEVAFQGVKPPAGKQRHVARFLGGIECGEHIRDLLDLIGRDAAAIISFEETLQSFVSKPPNRHLAECNLSNDVCQSPRFSVFRDQLLSAHAAVISLLEVAAGGGGEVSVQVRLPEALGDEVDDALFGLQRPDDTQEDGGLGQGGVPREDLRPAFAVSTQRSDCKIWPPASYSLAPRPRFCRPEDGLRAFCLYHPIA